MITSILLLAHSLVKVPFLSKVGVNKLVRDAKLHYAICHHKVVTAIKGGRKDPIETQYQRLVNAMGPQQLQQAEFDRLNRGVLVNCILKRKERQEQPVLLDHVFLEERAYVKNKLDEWMKDAKAHCDRLKNKEASQRAGTGVECSCCFDHYAIGDMVACRDKGHLFCCECLKAFAENQIYGSGNLGIDTRTKEPAHELKCFHGDGCSSGFDGACLKKALPPTTIRQLDSIQFQIRYVTHVVARVHAHNVSLRFCA
jgi:hypothetical protein